MTNIISHALFLQRLYAVTGTTEQKALAAVANVTSSAMSRIVGGQSYPSLETVARIAMETNTSMDYLVGLSDDPTPSERIAKKPKGGVRGPGKPSPRPPQKRLS
jgi:transcriptional regulator with XRE-family HTH domain